MRVWVYIVRENCTIVAIVVGFQLLYKCVRKAHEMWVVFSFFFLFFSQRISASLYIGIHDELWGTMEQWIGENAEYYGKSDFIFVYLIFTILKFRLVLMLLLLLFGSVWFGLVWFGLVLVWQQWWCTCMYMYICMYINIESWKCKQFINYQTLMRRQFLDHQLRWKIFWSYRTESDNDIKSCGNLWKLYLATCQRNKRWK